MWCSSEYLQHLPAAREDRTSQSIRVLMSSQAQVEMVMFRCSDTTAVKYSTDIHSSFSLLFGKVQHVKVKP